MFNVKRMASRCFTIRMGSNDAMMRAKWWNAPRKQWMSLLERREDQVFLVLTVIIGALVGLTVVAFILLTERVGMRLYPPGGETWRRLLMPVAGSLGIGYLLF